MKDEAGERLKDEGGGMEHHTWSAATGSADIQVGSAMVRRSRLAILL
jgi:hypothetical protein